MAGRVGAGGYRRPVTLNLDSRPALVLIGPPGAGKSTIGTLLATRLGVPFTDTDELVAERAGTSVGELLIDAGEARFREMEAEAVAEALTRPGVLALGGGAVEAATDLLERYRADGGTVVFLDVSLAAGMPRVGLNAPRPTTFGSPRAQFSTMAAQRRPVYEAAADGSVDTSDLTPEQVADHVQALMA